MYESNHFSQCNMCSSVIIIFFFNLQLWYWFSTLELEFRTYILVNLNSLTPARSSCSWHLDNTIKPKYSDYIRLNSPNNRYNCIVFLWIILAQYILLTSKCSGLVEKLLNSFIVSHSKHQYFNANIGTRVLLHYEIMTGERRRINQFTEKWFLGM
mgnify:CR=1 FL=1